MGDKKIIRKEYENYFHVTIYEYGRWLLMQNDINGYYQHLQCYGPVSFVDYKDYVNDFVLTYSIKRPLYDEDDCDM